MKKILFAIIAGVVLISGCNNSGFDGRSSTVLSSSVSEAPINEPTSDITVSASVSEPESLVSSSSTAISSTSKLPGSSHTASDNSIEPEPPTDKGENTLSITITVNGQVFSATLYDNETSEAFKALLPLTLDMSELNGNEKYYYLPKSLPRNSSKPSMINTGDIMLYGSDCLVIFYESFSTSYSYTPIGKIDDPKGLVAALGGGDVQVTFN